MDHSIIDNQKLSRNLGLSEYETRVYVALVAEGVSEGRKLGIKSGVPRTKVYSTLKKLMERGLVFELPGPPAKFAPTAPAEAFQSHLVTLQKQVSEEMVSIEATIKTLSSLEDTYQKKRLNAEPQSGEVWVIRRAAEVHDKIRVLLSQAKRSVRIVTNEKKFILFHKTYEKLLDRLVANNVEVRVGAPLDAYKSSFVRELTYVYKIEHLDVYAPTFFMCVDDCQFLLSINAVSNCDVNSGVCVAVFSRNLDICALVSTLLPMPVRAVFSNRHVEAAAVNRTKLLVPC